MKKLIPIYALLIAVGTMDSAAHLIADEQVGKNDQRRSKAGRGSNRQRQTQNRQRKGNSNGRGVIRRFDKDGDGLISKQESPNWLKRRFSEVDSDKNGKIDIDELSKSTSQGRNRTNPARSTGRRKQFPSVDVKYDVEFTKVGDHSLKLDILSPKSKEKTVVRPAIVFVHGGGWRAGDKQIGVNRLAPVIATGRYVGFSINYRLSGEKTWPAQINDCKAAIHWIHSHAKDLNVDPTKIAVWGTSAGGHLANMLGTTSGVAKFGPQTGDRRVSERVACVVSFCGPTDFVKYWPPRMALGAKAVSGLLGGTVPEKIDVAKAASPATYVSSDDPPFLLVHGTADPLVPIEQAESFLKLLRSAKVESSLIRITGGGHHLQGAEIQSRVIAFFDKHLLGKSIEVSDQPIVAENRPQRRSKAP